MSAGVFTIGRYQADVATVVGAVRLQPETIAAATVSTPIITNASATSATTFPGFIRTSAGRRTRSIRVRRISLGNPAAAPAGYKPGTVVKIVAQTPAFYNACTLGAQVTYLGTTWTVVSRTPELI